MAEDLGRYTRCWVAGAMDLRGEGLSVSVTPPPTLGESGETDSLARSTTSLASPCLRSWREDKDKDKGRLRGHRRRVGRGRRPGHDVRAHLSMDQYIPWDHLTVADDPGRATRIFVVLDRSWCDSPRSFAVLDVGQFLGVHTKYRESICWVAHAVSAGRLVHRLSRRSAFCFPVTFPRLCCR